MNEFDSLRKKLSELEEWPLKYMFKFIVPNEGGKTDKIKELLPPDGEFSYNHTKSLKYIAITCVATMESADDIISINTWASKIEGVMIL